MIYRSVRFQLGMIALLFAIFVVVVLFQSYYTAKMQGELLQQQKKNHDIISQYLVIEERERQLIASLESLVEERDGARMPEMEFQALNDEVTQWFAALDAWKKNLDQWKRSGGLHYSLKNEVFSPVFIKNKEKQAEGYRKILSLCKDARLKEGKDILRIEIANIPSVNSSVNSILESVSLQVREDIELSNNFYRSTALSVLLALIAILFVAAVMAARLTSSLKALERGAYRVSNGDFESPIVVKGPSELTSLAETFNEMQKAIKSRDEKIRDDSREIQKLNAVLEQKVEERNRTIINQNISLKRKNEELEQILYAASHDLRTPLISIQGFSEELKTACSSLDKALTDKAEQEEVDRIVKDEVVVALNYIINGSKRMEVLLEGLLRLSRMGRESLKIQELDMNELIRNVADTLSFQVNEANAELKIEDLCNCYGDPSQMEQVFFNLISNAIKYRDHNRKCLVAIHSEKIDGFSRYSVRDNGIGIPEENQERIFHAFYRVDEENGEGEGIGLAIVNRAVDLHNGRIWVESEIGKGSTFVLELPENEF